MSAENEELKETPEKEQGTAEEAAEDTNSEAAAEDTKEPTENEKPSDDEPSKEEKLENEVRELKDRILRNLAEFDNFRKRTAAEKSMMYSMGMADAAEKLLPVLDNFERALSSEPDKESGFYKGVEMIFKQMQTAFVSMGVEEIEAEGQVFDPNLHNAVMHIENEELGENVVSQVLQKGYKHKDRVIRPAMVQVAN